MEQDRNFLPRAELEALVHALVDAGYRCVGPQVRDGAVVYATLEGVEQLPQGVTDRQAPGSYRLGTDAPNRHFAWANGPQALKPLLFKPREQIWRVTRDTQGRLHFSATRPEVERIAVIGVRACDLAALRLSDQHFLAGEHQDPYYLPRRKGLLLVAVHCTHPADTCFCASTGDGPDARDGYDLVLTELDGGYLVASGSDIGAELLVRLPLQTATPQHRQQAASDLRAAVDQQRRLPSSDLHDVLLSKLESPQWEAIAARCLACGNCTSVCPTCFCHNEAETAALDGTASEHHREWDSCFSQGHSYIHGVTLRAPTALRYRQWLVHKLGTWHEQYGRSGCVGCGRCITWCPVGIDITAEVAQLCAEVPSG